MRTHRRRGFSCQASVPVVTVEIIAQFGFRVALDVHIFQPAVANKPTVALVNDREESVAETRLVREVALHPAFHLRPIK